MKTKNFQPSFSSQNPNSICAFRYVTNQSGHDLKIKVLEYDLLQILLKQLKAQ